MGKSLILLKVACELRAESVTLYQRHRCNTSVQAALQGLFRTPERAHYSRPRLASDVAFPSPTIK